VQKWHVVELTHKLISYFVCKWDAETPEKVGTNIWAMAGSALGNFKPWKLVFSGYQLHFWSPVWAQCCSLFWCTFTSPFWQGSSLRSSNMVIAALHCCTYVINGVRPSPKWQFHIGIEFRGITYCPTDCGEIIKSSALINIMVAKVNGIQIQCGILCLY